ncbi:MAG: hypothetical protein EHM58_10230 [Ignavibacteriae bacterium]|nr:MAG: hypothetical protein EHM58_10230 [Ignavibacteriota bacterium]
MDKDLPPDFLFCTECGRDLRNFALERKSFNVEFIKKNFASCRENGKFKGEFCSKLFIALDFDPDEFFIIDDDEE